MADQTGSITSLYRLLALSSEMSDYRRMTTDSRPQYWLINTRAGNGAGERLRLALAGISTITVQVINFATLTEQLNSIPSKTLVVVAGGDGTFSAVLGSSIMREREVVCVPLGTANDLAREFSIPRYLRGARYESYPQLLSQLPFQSCAVWTLHADGREIPFVNYIAIGYEGAVVRDFAAWRARAPFRGRLANRIAYTVLGLRHALTRLTTLSLRDHSGETRHCPRTTGIIVTNIQSHLGMALSNRKSAPSDDLIESVSVSNVFEFARMILAGLGLPIQLSPVMRSKGASIEGIPSGTPIQIDGEAGPSLQGGRLEVTFRHFIQIASAKKEQP